MQRRWPHRWRPCRRNLDPVVCLALAAIHLWRVWIDRWHWRRKRGQLGKEAASVHLGQFVLAFGHRLTPLLLVLQFLDESRHLVRAVFFDLRFHPHLHCQLQALAD